MELGKVPSSTEKGKDRKNSKEEEGDRFGRDKKGKQKEKKQARKDGRDGLASTGERQHQQFSQQERHILDPSSLRRKGQRG